MHSHRPSHIVLSRRDSQRGCFGSVSAYVCIVKQKTKPLMTVSTCHTTLAYLQAITRVIEAQDQLVESAKLGTPNASSAKS